MPPRPTLTTITDEARIVFDNVIDAAAGGGTPTVRRGHGVAARLSGGALGRAAHKRLVTLRDTTGR